MFLTQMGGVVVEVSLKVAATKSSVTWLGLGLGLRLGLGLGLGLRVRVRVRVRVRLEELGHQAVEEDLRHLR